MLWCHYDMALLSADFCAFNHGENNQSFWLSSGVLLGKMVTQSYIVRIIQFTIGLH